MGGFQKILEKYHMEKWFQRDNLIIMILAGILLIVIALPTKSSDADEDRSNANVLIGQTGSMNGLADNTYGTAQGTGELNNRNNTDDSTSDYAAYLEEKLSGILSKVKGAGDVYVMITLEESEELVVEKDFLQSEDSSGTQTQEETVFETEGNNSTPYVVKTVFPQVAGVVVIAEGAGTGTVTKTITEIVQALFHIEIHKIKVAGSISDSNVK